MNGGVQSKLSTLVFHNGEQIEYFHSITFILQHEIILSGETVSPTTLISHYIKALSKRDKLRALSAPNMAYIIIFLDNSGKYDVYTGGNIHGIYRYLDIIVAPTTLNTSGQRSRHFGPSSSIKKDTASLQPVITALRMRQKSICGCCGSIGHKADA